MLAEKFETLVVFMKVKKKKLKPPGAQAGPEGVLGLRRSAAPAAALARFILFLTFMKPPKFQIFCQHFRETTKN